MKHTRKWLAIALVCSQLLTSLPVSAAVVASDNAAEESGTIETPATEAVPEVTETGPVETTPEESVPAPGTPVVPETPEEPTTPETKPETPVKPETPAEETPDTSTPVHQVSLKRHQHNLKPPHLVTPLQDQQQTTVAPLQSPTPHRSK